jgi:hypothetical protein
VFLLLPQAARGLGFGRFNSTAGRILQNRAFLLESSFEDIGY